MNKTDIILFLFCITFFLTNCVEKSAVIEKEPSFFNLKEYFETQLSNLSKVKRVNKITRVDGNQIEKELDSIDFTQELKAFIESDINKVAWMDKYQVDSVFSKSKMLHQIIYKATDEKLRTQRMLVSFSQNEVDTIEILNNITGNVVQLKQRLKYIPSFGYSIESSQNTIFAEEHVLTVDVRFLK